MALGKGSRLGRGISELLGDSLEPSVPSGAVVSNQPITVSTSLLYPSPFQPREIFDEDSLIELASSILANGVIQPLIVRRSAHKDGYYEIVAGERRWRASIIAKISEVPIIIKDISDKQCCEFSIIENVQREDLSPVEEGEAYKRLIEQFSYRHDELSVIMGRSRSHITNMMRILSLPDSVRSMLNEKKISMGHARAMINIEDAAKVAKKVVSEGLSVRDTENLIKKMQTKKIISKQSRKNAEIINLENGLSARLGGVKVRIDERDGCGSVELSFKNLNQLDMLLHKLSN